MCILFVDDDKSCCNLYSGLCSEYNYKYNIINDFKDIDNEISNNKYSLICINNKNNIDIIHEIKKKSPDSILIIISDSTYLDNLIKLINSNDIFKYILKPFDKNVFISHIRQSFSFFKELTLKKKLIYNIRQKNMNLNELKNRIELDIFKTNECLKTSGNILMNFPCAIIIHNHVNQIIYYNKKAGKLLKINELSIGKDISDIFENDNFTSYSSLTNDEITLTINNKKYKFNYLFSELNSKYGLMILLESFINE